MTLWSYSFYCFLSQWRFLWAFCKLENFFREQHKTLPHKQQTRIKKKKRTDCPYEILTKKGKTNIFIKYCVFIKLASILQESLMYPVVFSFTVLVLFKKDSKLWNLLMIILAQTVSIMMNYSDVLLENILLVYSIWLTMTRLWIYLVNIKLIISSPLMVKQIIMV